MIRPLLLALALAVTACGAPPASEPPPATNALTITPAFERMPVTRTQNVLHVRVADAQGAKVVGASIEVALTMPAHGHGAAAPAVVELGDGDYEAAPVNFTMAGTWEVAVAVKKGALGGAHTLSVSSP